MAQLAARITDRFGKLDGYKYEVNQLSTQRLIFLMDVERSRYENRKIESTSHELKDNKISTILEAIEEISNKGLIVLSLAYLEFAKKYITSRDNSCKREASRIVGNLASQYPQAIRECIPALLDNAKDD